MASDIHDGLIRETCHNDPPIVISTTCVCVLRRPSHGKEVSCNTMFTGRPIPVSRDSVFSFIKYPREVKLTAIYQSLE